MTYGKPIELWMRIQLGYFSPGSYDRHNILVIAQHHCIIHVAPSNLYASVLFLDIYLTSLLFLCPAF